MLNPENDKVISVNSCDGCVIDHLDITTAPHYQDFQGILNNTPSRDLRITNNRIHHVGNDGGHDHGIYCKAPVPGGIFEGNWLYRNAAYGIIFYTNCDGVDFRYNVVANNGVLTDCNPDQPPNTRCPDHRPPRPRRRDLRPARPGPRRHRLGARAALGDLLVVA